MATVTAQRDVGRAAQHAGNSHAPPSWLQPIIESIPNEMKDMPRWVNWQGQKRGDKWTKVPYQANRNTKAKSNDPKTWAPFPLAFLGLRRRDRDGIGFVFGPDDNRHRP